MGQACSRRRSRHATEGRSLAGAGRIPAGVGRSPAEVGRNHHTRQKMGLAASMVLGYILGCHQAGEGLGEARSH